jgi:hypothetical protein
MFDIAGVWTLNDVAVAAAKAVSFLARHGSRNGSFRWSLQSLGTADPGPCGRSDVLVHPERLPRGGVPSDRAWRYIGHIFELPQRWVLLLSIHLSSLCGSSTNLRPHACTIASAWRPHLSVADGPRSIRSRSDTSSHPGPGGPLLRSRLRDGALPKPRRLCDGESLS